MFILKNSDISSSSSPPDSIHKNADLIILKQALFKLNRNKIKLINTSAVRLCISNIHQLQFGWNEPLIQSVGCETGSEHLMMLIQKHEAQRRPVSSSRCVNVMICDNEAFVYSFTDSGSVYRESWCQSSLQSTSHTLKDWWWRKAETGLLTDVVMKS